MGWILRIYPVFLELIRKKNQGCHELYFNFKMNCDSACEFTRHNLARFQNSLKNSFDILGCIIFMRWIVFLEFSQNNGKSGKDYI